MTAYPPFPTTDPHWVYDDPSGVPEQQPAPFVPSVPPVRKAA